MSFHDELIKDARDAVDREPSDETQGRLRRTVSTAYYALFHLLIAETVAHWSLPEQRERLARAFEHKHMKKASDQVRGRAYSGADPTTVEILKRAAATFVELQQCRIEADYDKAKPWTWARASSKVEEVELVFYTIGAIRDEPIFQDYLLSLLIPERFDDQP